MVTIQNYVRAQSIDEAYELNQKKGSCIIGGQFGQRDYDAQQWSDQTAGMP